MLSGFFFLVSYKIDCVLTKYIFIFNMIPNLKFSYLKIRSLYLKKLINLFKLRLGVILENVSNIFNT